MQKICKKYLTVGPWWWSSGQRARLLSVYPSSNPAEFFILFCNVLEKNENKQEEAGDDTIKKHTTVDAFRRNASFEKGAKCLKLSESFSIVFALAPKM